jgi:hypothetical protein
MQETFIFRVPCYALIFTYENYYPHIKRNFYVILVQGLRCNIPCVSFICYWPVLKLTCLHRCQNKMRRNVRMLLDTQQCLENSETELNIIHSYNRDYVVQYRWEQFENKRKGH